MTILTFLPFPSQAGYLTGHGHRRSAGHRQNQKHKHHP